MYTQWMIVDDIYIYKTKEPIKNIIFPFTVDMQNSYRSDQFAADNGSYWLTNYGIDIWHK